MADSRKARFRGGLKRFYLDHFGEEEQKLNDIQRSKGLGLFYLTEVYAKLNPGLIPENLDDIEECFVDGKDDQGVDFLVSKDGFHILVQCKYRGKSKKIEDESEVTYFKDVFRRIHPDSGYKKNEPLSYALEGIDWKDDKFLIIFVSLGRDTEDIRISERRDFSEINHPALKDIKNRAEFRFLSEEDLNKEYRDSLNPKYLVEVKIRAQRDSKNSFWYCYNNEEGLRSYITTLNAAQTYELYESKREALFNLNIRYFIGDTPTNKGIIETAEEKPEKFFFYNNGVSAVAAKVTVNETDGILSCKDFSIINGAQSIRSVHRAYRRLEGHSKEDVKNLAIMLRVTETQDLHKGKPGFIEDITRYNNTQNAIKIFDFRSNDGVQKSLVSHFEKKSYQGEKYFYKNKRIRAPKRNRIPINLDDFCKTLHSFRKGPADAFGGIEYLYNTTPSGGYYYLFGDKESNSILDVLSDEQFEEYAAIYFVCDFAHEIFKEQKKEREVMERRSRGEGTDDNQPLLSRRALERKFLFFYVLGQAFDALAKKNGNSKEEFLVHEEFNDPRCRDDEKKKQLIDKLVSLACDVLVSDYQSVQNHQKFSHREWFRDPETLKRLKNGLIGNLGRLSEISSSYLPNAKSDGIE